MIIILEEDDQHNDCSFANIPHHLQDTWLTAHIVLQQTGNNEFKILKSRYAFADTCDILKNKFSKSEFYE